MTGLRGRRSRAESGDDQREAIFLRGLTIGALIGAAIAGSALWSRVARRVRPADPEPGIPVEREGDLPDDAGAAPARGS